MSGQWTLVLSQVLGSKTSMKLKKAIKRASKLTQCSGNRTRKDMEKEMESLLARWENSARRLLYYFL
jgi:hypothetical protein